MGLMNMFDSGGGGSSTEEESRQRTKRRRARRKKQRRQKKPKKEKKKRSAFLNNFSFGSTRKKSKPEKKKKKSSVQKWKESDDATKLRKDYQEADSHQGRFDVAARGGFDFLLDNPSASVQDTTRGVLKKSYEAGAGREVSDQELVDAYADAAGRSKKRWDDATPDSRALKWTGAAADFLIADTAKAAGTAVTGVDIDKRTSEGTVGAAEAFDVGVTLGTFDVGKAAGAGVKGAAKSGKGGSLLSRVGLTKGDDAGTAARASRGGDETAAASRTSRATQSADDTDDLLPVLRQTDEIAVRQVDETGTTAAKASRTAAAKSAKAGDESSGLVGRISTRAGKLSDDATRASSRAKRGAGTAAGKAGTFGAKASGKVAKAGGKVAGSKTVKYGTGGAIAIGGGGLLYDYLQSNSEVTVEDPDTGELYRLTKVDSYQPTDEHTEGGTSWRVDRIETAAATDPDTGEEVLTTVGFDTIGYTVIVGVSGKNVFILGQDGERVRSRATSETWNKAREAQGPGGRV